MAGAGGGPALLAALLFCTLSAPMTLHASQEPENEGGHVGEVGLSLTLSDAVDRALRNNPAYARTRNDLELNTLDRRDRWLDILPAPQVTLLNTSLNWSRTTTAEDIFGEPVPREVVEWVQTSRSSQGVGLGLSVNLGDFLELRQQSEVALGRELAVESSALALRAQVRLAFIDLQERVEVMQLEEELLRMARVNRDLARQLYALGMRERIDVVALELDLVEQEHVLQGSRASVEVARHTLRTAIGDPGLGGFEIVPVALATFDPKGVDVEALVQNTTESAPSVGQARASIRMEEREASLTRAEWLPTVSAFWNSQRQDFVRGNDAFFDPNPNVGWDGSVGISVSFPDLGQFFRRGIEQQRSAVALENSQQSLREVRNQVEQDVRTFVNDLRWNARSLGIQERRTALAVERLQLARDAYRLGEQSHLDLQGAQEQVARAERDLLTARYAFERARIQLERVSGMNAEEILRLSDES